MTKFQSRLKDAILYHFTINLKDDLKVLKGSDEMDNLLNGIKALKGLDVSSEEIAELEKDLSRYTDVLIREVFLLGYKFGFQTFSYLNSDDDDIEF